MEYGGADLADRSTSGATSNISASIGSLIGGLAGLALYTTEFLLRLV
jgi:hypothetical protein